MKILEVTERTPSLLEQLIIVWERSVKATHLFLSEIEVEEIKTYIPQALNGIPHLIIAKNENNCPVAFMGLEEQNWKCFLFRPKNGERDWGESCSGTGLKTTQSTNWPSMSRTRLRKVFMSIWVFRFINERTMTSKAILIRFYT